MRLLRDLICLLCGHRWTVDPLSHVCIRCGTVEKRWTGHIDLAITDLRSKKRSPFEDRVYDALRSMFGHKD